MVSASSCGSMISNCSVPGSVVRHRLPCAFRCFRYSARFPGAVFNVATIASLAIFPPVRRSGPAELLQGHAGIPDFCHVADPVAGKLHDVDIVGVNLLAGRRDRSALAGMGSEEDGERRHVLALIVTEKDLSSYRASGSTLSIPFIHSA